MLRHLAAGSGMLPQMPPRKNLPGEILRDRVALDETGQQALAEQLYRSPMAGQSGADVAILTPRTIASATTSAARDPIVVSGRSGFWSFPVDTAKS